MEVHHVNIINKTCKKIRGEITYNSNAGVLNFTLYDREDTIYVDVNPEKSVNLPSKWIRKESEGETNVAAAQTSESKSQT